MGPTSPPSSRAARGISNACGRSEAKSLPGPTLEILHCVQDDGPVGGATRLYSLTPPGNGSEKNGTASSGHSFCCSNSPGCVSNADVRTRSSAPSLPIAT